MPSSTRAAAGLVALAAALGSGIGLAQAGDLEGVVLRESAREDYPLEYVQVEVCPQAGGSCVSAWTGSNGRFSFTDLAAGTYEVRVHLGAGQPATSVVELGRGGRRFVEFTVE